MSNIDGIKKITEDELKMKREIILGMIGEDADAPKLSKRKMDSILMIKKIPAENISHDLIIEAQKRQIENHKKEWQEELKKSVLVDVDIPGKTTPVEKVKSVPEVVQETEKPVVLKKKKSVKKEEVLEEKNTPKKNIKKIVSKIEKKSTPKIKSDKTVVFRLIRKIKRIIKNISFILMMSILLGNIIYLSFFLIVILSKSDNGFFRFLGTYLPVPALIVDSRFVNYFDYIDQKSKINSDELFVREELIKKVLKENFFRKYHTNDVAILNKYLVANENVNSAALNRARKIKNLIIKGDDFDQIAGKYGDRRESLILKNDDYAKYEYGDKIKDLKIGELSDIIVAQDGYYLFKCYEKSDTEASLSYIFIQAKGLDEYLDQAAKNIYYVSFVE